MKSHRPKSSNADAAFTPDLDRCTRLMAVPAVYRGDKARRVVRKDGGTDIEPGLYPELAGHACRIVEDRGEGLYPLVLDFNGWRGIARRECVEVMR